MSKFKPTENTLFWAYEEKSRIVHFHHFDKMKPFKVVKYTGNKEECPNVLIAIDPDDPDNPFNLKLADWRFLPAPKSFLFASKRFPGRCAKQDESSRDQPRVLSSRLLSGSQTTRDQSAKCSPISSMTTTSFSPALPNS